MQAFSEKAAGFPNLFMDNVFIALVNYSGILGLLAFSGFWVSIGVSLFRVPDESRFGFCVWVFFSFVSLTSTFFADVSNVMFAISVFCFCLLREHAISSKENQLNNGVSGV